MLPHMDIRPSVYPCFDINAAILLTIKRELEFLDSWPLEESPQITTHIIQLKPTPTKMRGFPHETQWSAQIGLSEFTYEMQEAFKSGDSLEYINVALCDHLSQDNKPHCVVLNARMGLRPPASPTFTRDFDSAIGVTCNLPFTAAFDVFPVPPFRDTVSGKSVPMFGTFWYFENNLSITTNGTWWLVYERQSLTKAIQQCNDHVILISNHGDISKSIWGIIGTLLHLSFYI